MDLTDALTSVPVPAGTGAVLLALLVGLALVLRRRRARRADDVGDGHDLPDYALHELRAEQAAQLRKRWSNLQRDFVDAPVDTLRRADALLAEAMRERGFPAIDADGRRELLGEHEPQHVTRYDRLRDAISDAGGDWSTEQRRQALLETRTLFDALLRGESPTDPRELFAA